jgi:archaemetzincin
MNAIHLLAVVSGKTNTPLEGGAPSIAILDGLAAELARIFQVSCHVREESLGADFAYDPGRGQYHSTAILQRLEPLVHHRQMRIIGITELDLFIPVLTFVFGEAQLGGCCALVSTHRLHEEFYGLPPNKNLLFQRLLKESAHELGHTLGLRHCLDWRCVMASTHDVERLDIKNASYCSSCLAKGSLEGPAPQEPRITFNFKRIR